VFVCGAACQLLLLCWPGQLCRCQSNLVPKVCVVYHVMPTASSLGLLAVRVGGIIVRQLLQAAHLLFPQLQA
jgi:hypothetical protein